jgi:hypothetical protein
MRNCPVRFAAVQCRGPSAAVSSATDGTGPWRVLPDRDGLSAKREKQLGTSDLQYDSDGDGYNDGADWGCWVAIPTGRRMVAAAEVPGGMAFTCKAFALGVCTPPGLRDSWMTHGNRKDCESKPEETATEEAHLAILMESYEYQRTTADIAKGQSQQAPTPHRKWCTLRPGSTRPPGSRSNGTA